MWTHAESGRHLRKPPKGTERTQRRPKRTPQSGLIFFLQFLISQRPNEAAGVPWTFLLLFEGRRLCSLCRTISLTRRLLSPLFIQKMGPKKRKRREAVFYKWEKGGLRGMVWMAKSWATDMLLILGHGLRALSRVVWTMFPVLLLLWCATRF